MQPVDLRLAAILLAAAPLLWGGPGAADEAAFPSCAELARRQAERQYTEETAALDDRTEGQMRDSALQREFLRLDAESYRKEVYEDCVRRRGGAPKPAPRPAPSPAVGD